MRILGRSRSALPSKRRRPAACHLLDAAARGDLGDETG